MLGLEPARRRADELRRTARAALAASGLADADVQSLHVLADRVVDREN